MTNHQTTKTVYGVNWPYDTHPVEIEKFFIRNNGYFTDPQGVVRGRGLYHHYRVLQALYWPNKKWHRWNELLLKSFVENSFIGVIGGANSGKTRESADYCLSVYSVFPKETTVLVSSTDIRSLRVRIWGEMKANMMVAKKNYPSFPGYINESQNSITTDGKFDEFKDHRNGVLCIPCVVGGNFVGISKFVGIKNKRVILAGDELSLMSNSYMDSVSNLSKNPNFQCIGMGNPKDRTDPLGVLCEPSNDEGGWEGISEEEVTKTWRTRYGGICVQLVGTDSPNFDVPDGEPEPYSFLIGRKAIKTDLDMYGKESIQFSMMNLGMFPKGTSSRRVITRQICERFRAMEDPVWGNAKLTKVVGLDAAYSGIGGDRCVLTESCFGEDTTGTVIFAVTNVVIVPVSQKDDRIPEDQIADFCMRYCIEKNIPPENLGFDSTGKGSLGTAFARVWSSAVNPVEFGGKASDRPVSEQIKALCKDFYSKFVTELWYSSRYCIEAGQFRGMTEEILNEGTMREWTIVAGNKIEVEPKDKMKKRFGRSPDIYDSVVLSLEMARRKGFKFSNTNKSTRNNSMDWLKQLQDKARSFRNSKQLTK